MAERTPQEMNEGFEFIPPECWMLIIEEGFKNEWFFKMDRKHFLGFEKQCTVLQTNLGPIPVLEEKPVYDIKYGVVDYHFNWQLENRLLEKWKKEHKFPEVYWRIRDEKVIPRLVIAAKFKRVSKGMKAVMEYFERNNISLFFDTKSFEEAKIISASRKKAKHGDVVLLRDEGDRCYVCHHLWANCLCNFEDTL